MAVLLAVTLVGCGNKLTPANFEKIETNMTTVEVKTILGEPTSIETQDIPLLSTTRYVYQKGNNEITLVFLNDKLMSKSGSLNP